jgi:molecular chaperone GrpE (heat shock protein)
VNNLITNRDMKQEHKQILKDIYDILNPSDFINAVYKTPAQNLRDSANELERREKVENAFREMLEEYGILKETPKSIVSE